MSFIIREFLPLPRQPQPPPSRPLAQFYPNSLSSSYLQSPTSKPLCAPAPSGLNFPPLAASTPHPPNTAPSLPFLQAFQPLGLASNCCSGKENHATSLPNLHNKCTCDHKPDMNIHSTLPRNLTAMLRYSLPMLILPK